MLLNLDLDQVTSSCYGNKQSYESYLKKHNSFSILHLGIALQEYRLVCTGWLDDEEQDIWLEVPSVEDGQNTPGISFLYII